MSVKLTGDQYIQLDGKLAEIKRQMRQLEGYPFDPKKLDVFLQRAIEGKLEIQVVVSNHTVDLDADPFMPDDWKKSGWKVESHQKGGQFKFDPAKVELYLSKKQKNGVIGGHDLRKELKNQPVMNANLLDFYLAHPELIPEDWKGKAVFFWGTIYRNDDGDLSVRCLYWNGSRWGWLCDWLDDGWYSYNPAACRK